MYRPRQHSTFNGSNNVTWGRNGSAPFRTSAETPSNDKIDHSLLLERNAYEGLLPESIGIILKPGDETEDKPEDLEMTNYKCIGSYSWVEAAKDTPTILVPGSPPRWKSGSLPLQVPQPDKSPRIIDQNVFRASVGGIGQLFPIIAAVTYNQRLRNEPHFDWSSVDIVADLAALRKLIRWANNKLTFKQKIRKSDSLFRLDLQLVGEKTILINRVPLKYAEEQLYRSYREGFRKGFMTTAPGCRNALDYHRIISYDIDGLKMVLRSEVDAYDTGAFCGEQVEELASSLVQAASIQPPGTLRMQRLTIQRAGEEIPQTSLLELVTRWGQNSFQMDWNEVYCQLFLSRIQKHAIAYQDGGVFDKIEERMLDSAPELETTKTEALNQMKKLMKAIKRIRELVMKEGKDSRLSLVCVYGVLRVYKRRSQESCLPDDVLELFE